MRTSRDPRSSPPVIKGLSGLSGTGRRGQAHRGEMETFRIISRYSRYEWDMYNIYCCMYVMQNFYLDQNWIQSANSPILGPLSQLFTGSNEGRTRHLTKSAVWDVFQQSELELWTDVFTHAGDGTLQIRNLTSRVFLERYMSKFKGLHGTNILAVPFHEMLTNFIEVLSEVEFDIQDWNCLQRSKTATPLRLKQEYFLHDIWRFPRMGVPENHGFQY